METNVWVHKIERTGLIVSLIKIVVGKESEDSCLGSYQVESTGSRPIPEVKQPRAESVPGRETAWEHSVT